MFEAKQLTGVASACEGIHVFWTLTLGISGQSPRVMVTSEILAVAVRLFVGDSRKAQGSSCLMHC